jgi:hypothetical protein
MSIAREQRDSIFSACATQIAKRSLTAGKGAFFDFTKPIQQAKRLRIRIPCSTSGYA